RIQGPVLLTHGRSRSSERLDALSRRDSGQILTRARSSSYVNGLPILRAPQEPLSRLPHPTAAHPATTLHSMTHRALPPGSRLALEAIPGVPPEIAPSSFIPDTNGSKRRPVDTKPHRHPR